MVGASYFKLYDFGKPVIQALRQAEVVGVEDGALLESLHGSCDMLGGGKGVDSAEMVGVADYFQGGVFVSGRRWRLGTDWIA